MVYRHGGGESVRGGEQRLAGTNVLEHRLKDLALIVTNAFLCRHHQAGRQAGRHTRQAHQAGTPGRHNERA
jgi:hypothetical protein